VKFNQLISVGFAIELGNIEFSFVTYLGWLLSYSLVSLSSYREFCNTTILLSFIALF